MTYHEHKTNTQTTRNTHPALPLHVPRPYPNTTTTQTLKTQQNPNMAKHPNISKPHHKALHKNNTIQTSIIHTHIRRKTDSKTTLQRQKQKNILNKANYR